MRDYGQAGHPSLFAWIRSLSAIAAWPSPIAGGPMTHVPPEPEALLTPAEVAALFRVDPKTVTRWAKAGKLSAIRTLGGHRRYRAAEVQALLAGVQGDEPQAPPPHQPGAGD
jgi:excisionase family DNA binding protein